MKFDQEYIYQLLLEKQLGEISKENDRYLQQVMEYDEHVRNCWLELENAKVATNDDILEDLRADLVWCKIEALLKPQPSFPTRVLRLLKKHRAAIAASVFTAIITAGGLVFYLRYQPNPTAPAAVAAAVNTAPVTGHAPALTAAAPAAAANNPGGPVPGSLPAKVAADTLLRIVHTADTTSSTFIARADDAPVKVQWNTLTVPPKTDYRLELADGTEVHLNASSTLRFPFIFPGKTREVYLDGEAYFDVAKNPRQPFIVHTPSTSVKALGTAFNINSYNADMVITSLVQGAAVTDVGDSLDVTLKPGYEAIYKPGERFKVKRFDEAITLSWREGIYRFNKTRLADLQPVIQRWFGLKLAFEPQSIATMEYSGCLEKARPLSEFLTLLTGTLKLDYRVYDNTIHFYTRKAKWQE
ncbi:MAG TPA: FecR domain-containing protein [Chitinophaga sp.]|uniref:FecR family protein n=1 Tax=Chitinophaga sp. TaxID=1869181 RepID=UPI002DBF27D8|nr:FecR domain-containing protein [Chitinophaga sp.]HEU4556181.1 FecR domain-containing protein [Chitinophaga sp.]